MSGSTRMPWAGPQPGDGTATRVAAAVLGGAELPAAAVGTLTVVKSESAEGAPPPSVTSERSVGVDETNTSIIVDERVIVKFVSTWRSAERSARLLSLLAGHDLTPTYFGRVDWHLPDEGSSTVALVSEFLPGSEDGWTWAVDDLLRWFDGGPDPVWPAALGIRTAQMHAVLSAGAQTVEIDAAGYRVEAQRAVQASRLAGRAEDGDRIEALGRVVARLAEPMRAPVFSLHGDLHVGQFLRAPDAAPDDPASYRVIDFDGDPQGPDDALHPAAMDVAHLSVSLWAVAAVAHRRRDDPDAKLADWAGRASAQLVGAYRAALHDLGVDAGQNQASFEPLLRHFEAEQIAREVTYAARFLPEFAYASQYLLGHRFAAGE